MTDRNEFLDLAYEAGLGHLASKYTADALGISEDYAKQLRAGTHKITGPIRAKLEAMIAAKANGPEPVEQFEVDLPAEPDPVFAPVIQRADAAVEPVRSTLGWGQNERRYRVTGRTVRCEEVTFTEVATFASPVAASEYADWLNDQIRRGKEVS